MLLELRRWATFLALVAIGMALALGVNKSSICGE